MTTATAPRNKSAKKTATQKDPGNRELAIRHREGPCLVFAGPGSGKTHVIVERFVSLVSDDKISPENLLALTYNRRAADEMLARVEKKLGPLSGIPTLTTYHSFAQRIVEQFSDLLGFPGRVRIASEAERWWHLSDVVKDVKPDLLYEPTRPYENLASIMDVLQRAKQELVRPYDYLEWAKFNEHQADEADKAEAIKHLGIARVYEAMQERYRQYGILDYDDMILMTTELLLEQASVQQYCSRYQYVMVDEYQDTNTAQAVLVERLVGKLANILVVADDDQSIYKFRGASRVNLERFRKTYPNHIQIPLLVNHRSTPEIVNASHKVIEISSGREEKVIKPSKPSGAKIQVIQALSRDDEAQAIAQRCQELIDAGEKWKDIAVLFRNNDDLEAVASAMQLFAVPYLQIGGRDFFKTREVKNLMALLEAISNPENSLAIMKCLWLPNWRMSAKARNKAVDALSYNPDTPLIERLEKGDIASLSEEDISLGKKMASEIWSLNSISLNEDVRVLFQEALNQTSYAGVLDVKGELERLQAGANLSRFKDILGEFAESVGEYKLRDALRYLNVLKDGGKEGAASLPESAELDAVQISTIHSAKGLEWKHVILGGLVEGKLPSRSYSSRLELPDALVEMPSPEEDMHVEEERRLFYVGMTRPMETLTLTYSLRYPKTWSNRVETPSQFIKSIPSELIDFIEKPLSPPIPRKVGFIPVIQTRDINLTYSSMFSFDNCPKQYMFRNVLNLPEMDSEDAWFGRLMHSSLEVAARRLQRDEKIGRKEIIEIWSKLWEESKGLLIGQTEELKEAGSKMLTQYVDSALWTNAQPQWLEYTFSLPLGGDDGILLRGRFDRVDSDGKSFKIVDYKTGLPRDASKISSDLQLYIYACAAVHLLGIKEIECEIHWLRDATSSTVFFDATKLSRARSRLEIKGKEIRQAYETKLFPAKPSRFLCARCSYNVVCSERAE